MPHTRTARPPRHLRAMGFVTVVALVGALVGVSCGDNGDGERQAVPGAAGTEAEPSVDTGELCSLWGATFAADADGTGLPPAFTEALEEHAPPALEPDVAVFVEYDRRDREARTEDSEGSEAPDLEGEDLAAVARVMAWVQTTCTDGSFVAPPLDSLPAALEVCAAAAFPAELVDDLEPGRTVVYAPADADDPYAGPVLSLMWGPGSHRGDGDATPVTLRQSQGATDAVVAPITVFQQTVLPDLGTVVAWTEDGQGFGLYGRGWDFERSAELVAIAEGVERTSTDDSDTPAYRITDATLPSGFTEIHSGPASGVSVMAMGTYMVSFRAGPADADEFGTYPIVQLSGTRSAPGDDELWRLLALESERIEVGGTTVSITDRAWSPEGPVIASWRTGDGHVIVTGIESAGEATIDRDLVLQVVEASRELTDEEWIALSAGTDFC